MKKVNQFILFAFFLLFILTQTQSEEITGKIIHAEGTVSVRHGLEVLNWNNIRSGHEAGEYDLLSTGSEGFLQIELSTENQGKVTLSLESNTVVYFYLSRDRISAEHQISVTVLSGSVLIKISENAEGRNIGTFVRNLYIDSSSADYHITNAPDGSVLISCHTGKVRCTAGEGNWKEISAGSALELYQGSLMREIDIGDQILESYRNEWFIDRERNFREGAFSILKPAAINYEAYADRFNVYYRELNSQDRIFYLYGRGNHFKMELDKINSDLEEISYPIAEMKRVFFDFEEYFYRIEELKRYNDIIPVRGLLRRRYYISDFMEDYADKYNSISKKLAQIRTYFKIYDYLHDLSERLIIE